MTNLQTFLVATVRQAGIAQITLAQEVGITEKHMSQLMNGHASGSIEIWDKLLAAVGVEL